MGESQQGNKYLVARLGQLLDGYEKDAQAEDEYMYRCGIKDAGNLTSCELYNRLPLFFWRRLNTTNCLEAQREGYKFYSKLYSTPLWEREIDEIMSQSVGR